AGLTILRGRGFNEAESTRRDGPAVVIIDDVLAGKLWPDGNALGQYIQFATGAAPVADSDNNNVGMTSIVSGDIKPGESIQIIGIVRSIRNALFVKDPPGQIYLPFSRGFQSDITYFVRFRTLSHSGELAAAESIRHAVRYTDPALPILSLRTFEQHLDGNIQ